MGCSGSSSTSFSYTTILYNSAQQRISKWIYCILLLAISSSPYIMKSKKFQSKKFAFDLPIPKSLSVPSLLSSFSLRDGTSDSSMSEIYYAKSVTQTANMLLASQVNSGASQKSIIIYVPVEPTVIEIVVEHISMLHTQGIENTTARPILKSLAIPYQENHSVDPDLWDSSFAPI